MNFDDAQILVELISMSPEEFDELPFGVIGMTLGSVVTIYNRFEAEIAGFAPEDVIGKHFFKEVAPCTNNMIVAGVYEDAATVDEVIPYIFTLRGELSEVRLRLIKNADRQFLLVERLDDNFTLN